jgi:glycosyltransferase involved in cell wall biosynthesis
LHNEKLDEKIRNAHDIYDAAARILTVSKYIKSRVVTVNHNDTKTKVVYNGIDLSAFNSNVVTSRSSLGLKEDDFILVFSGRINRDKGIMELIEAMNLLTDEPNIKLMVIGSSFYGNTDFEDEFLQELQNKAAPLTNRIIFTGFIPYQHVPDYLACSNVAVIPSVWDDPFPTTVLEAQAIGLPIITTRRGGIPEEVTEDNAILLKTDEHFVNNLANAILDLYQHPQKRKQMSTVSIQRSKMFDKETYARSFFNVIGRIDV